MLRAVHDHQGCARPDPSAGEDRATLPRTPSIPEIRVMGTYKGACSHAPSTVARPGGACKHAPYAPRSKPAPGLNGGRGMTWVGVGAIR